MLSPQALLKVLVSRSLPAPGVDGPESERIIRGGRYGEGYTLPLVRKSHALADEGSYFTANGAQTAITGQTTTAYDATKPSLLLVNTEPVGGKRYYIDYIALLAGGTAYSNATSNTAILASVATDAVNRYSSGGTALTIQNPNQDAPLRATGAQAYAGAIVTLTASQLRTLAQYRLMRLPVSATALTLANVDRFLFNFGGVEGAAPDLQLQASATLEATAASRQIAMPPVVIGPGHSFLFNVNCIAGGAVTAGNFFYEIGWWER